jgi:hypothetical protein
MDFYIPSVVTSLSAININVVLLLSLEYLLLLLSEYIYISILLLKRRHIKFSAGFMYKPFPVSAL